MSCAKLRRNRRKPYLLKFSQIETNTIRMTQRETTLAVITKECKKLTRETKTEFHKIPHTWRSIHLRKVLDYRQSLIYDLPDCTVEIHAMQFQKKWFLFTPTVH